MVIKIEKGKLDSSSNFVSERTFIFTGVDNVNDRESAPNIKINAPGKSSDETVNLNLNGLQRFISFDFKLINDDEDKSNGTYSSEVKTIDEQYLYLKSEILSGSSEVQYRLTINNIVFMVCLIDDLTLNPTFNNPNYYKGSIQLSEGKNPLSVQTS